MSLDRIFNKKSLPIRSRITDWVNIKESLGTQVGGIFLGYFEVPATGNFKAQVGVALQDVDDEAKVYGVNLPEYFGKELSFYQVGDECGFEYYKDIPAKEKGMSDTKAIRPYNPDHEDRKKKGEASKGTEIEAHVESEADQQFENGLESGEGEEDINDIVK